MNNKPGLIEFWNDVALAAQANIKFFVDDKYRETVESYPFTDMCPYLAVAIARLIYKGGITKFQERAAKFGPYKTGLSLMQHLHPHARSKYDFDFTKL